MSILHDNIETDECRSLEFDDYKPRQRVLTEGNMRIEDLEYETNGANTLRNSNPYNTVDVRDSKWDQNDSKLLGTIQGLMSEKEKLQIDTEKIKQNKDILPRNKLRMLKSARNLSCTINALLEKSKDRLSEYYDSQLRDKSVSPGKGSIFDGFRSNGSRLDSGKDKQFNLSNQAKIVEESKRYNTNPSNNIGFCDTDSKGLSTVEKENRLMSSQNNYPSFRSDVAFNFNKECPNFSPRFNQSGRSDKNFKENMEPNREKSIRTSESSSELIKVKSLLDQAIKEIETKNLIIEKFEIYKQKVEEIKTQEMEGLLAKLEERRKYEVQMYIEYNQELKQELENYK